MKFEKKRADESKLPRSPRNFEQQPRFRFEGFWMIAALELRCHTHEMVNVPTMSPQRCFFRRD